MDQQVNHLLLGIDTVIIRVSDIRKGKTWYQEKLGLKTVWEDEKAKLVVLDTNAVTSLTLWQSDPEVAINKHNSSFPIFKTPDAAALLQLLKNKKVRTGELIEDQYVRYFMFYDVDDNLLEACQVL